MRWVAWMSWRTFRSPTGLPAVIARGLDPDNCRKQAISLIEGVLSVIAILR